MFIQFYSIDLDAAFGYAVDYLKKKLILVPAISSVS